MVHYLVCEAYVDVNQCSTTRVSVLAALPLVLPPSSTQRIPLTSSTGDFRMASRRLWPPARSGTSKW